MTQTRPRALHLSLGHADGVDSGRRFTNERLPWDLLLAWWQAGQGPEPWGPFCHPPEGLPRVGSTQRKAEP